MKRRKSRPSRLTGPFALAVAVAVSLAMSACAPIADPAEVSDFVADPAALSDFERELADILRNPALIRPTFDLTLGVPGEWVSQGALKKGGTILSFVAADDGPRAVVKHYRNHPKGRRYAAFAEVDGDWQRTSRWVNQPVEQIASFVAIGNDVVAVGPRDGGDGPWSFVVGAYPAAFPPAGDRAAEVVVRKAAAGNGTVMAIGRRDDRATAWRSVDGTEWNEVPLPIETSYPSTTLLDLVFVNRRWFIVARHTVSEANRQQLIAMTSDDGSQWQETTLEPPPTGEGSWGMFGHDGSHVQVLNSDFSWASADGTTWGPPIPVATTPVGTAVQFTLGPRAVDGTVLTGSISYRNDRRYCFETDQPCFSTPPALWVLDGDAWSLLAPPDIPYPRTAAIIDDALYVGGWQTIYKWSPEGGDHLPRAAPIVTTPPRMTLPLDTSSLESGVVYAKALTAHATLAIISCVYANNQTWGVSAVAPGAIDIVRRSGAVADGELFGVIELVGRDLIEFAVPGYGPIAYFEPEPVDECDRSGTL